MPAIELTIGALIPRQDVQKYLNYCDISYPVAELVVASVSRTGGCDFQGVREELAVAGETGITEHHLLSQSSPSVGRPSQQDASEDALSEHPVAIREQAAIPSGPLLDIREVSARTGISVSMLHEKMRSTSRYFDPAFPLKINLGVRTIRYSQAAVDSWIQSCLSSADR